VDKEKVVYALIGIPFTHKKNEILSFCDNMDKTARHYGK
jgi:hypothetical protein